MTLRKERRDTGSIHSDACSENSCCSAASNSGVPASSSTDRQYRMLVCPVSFARTSASVSFAFRFRIEATQGGQFQVPALTAEQGSKKAQTPPARFTVQAVDDTRDMQLRLVLPERPLWVGETVDATLEWYLRRDVVG